jgi:hypothetical protein
MHEPKHDELPGISLGDMTARYGAPLVDWHRPSSWGDEWHLLSWGCGCAVSYANDSLNDAEHDVQIECCDRHRSNRRATRARRKR